MSYNSFIPDGGVTVTLIELGLSFLIVGGDLGLNLGQPLHDGLDLVHAGVRNPLFSQIPFVKGQ